MQATFFSEFLPTEGQLIYYGAAQTTGYSDTPTLLYPRLGRWQQGYLISATLFIERIGSHTACWAPVPKSALVPATV